MYKQTIQSWTKHLDFILLDLLALLLSLYLAYFLYNGNFNLFGTEIYRNLTLILLLLDAFVCILLNTMHNVLHRSVQNEIRQTVKQTAVLFSMLVILLFAAKYSTLYSRVTIFYTSCIYTVLSFLTRMLWKKGLIRYGRKPEKRKMILVCREEDVARVMERSGSLDETAFVGVILTDRDGEGDTADGLPVVANLKNAADYICREWVDEVFFFPRSMAELEPAEDKEEGEENGVARLLGQCRIMAVPVHIRVPLGQRGENGVLEKVNGFHVVTLAANYASSLQLLIKRLLDIAGGAVGSVLALLVIAIVGPIIKAKSPGPILFKQERVGQNGKHFTLYKIRSMDLDAEEKKKEYMDQNRVSDDRMFKLDFDPRIIGNEILPDGSRKTGIGEFIRRTSLDEFPQFFNVLLNQMSLVGTRPPTVDEWEKYQYHHRARLAFKPGITGLWQISGRSNITDFEEVVKLDTEYIEHWSNWLDICILFKTLRIMVSGDGAM